LLKLAISATKRLAAAASKPALAARTVPSSTQCAHDHASLSAGNEPSSGSTGRTQAGWNTRLHVSQHSSSPPWLHTSQCSLWSSSLSSLSSSLS
jgi:hypothetical protein